MNLPNLRYKRQEEAVKALVARHGARSVTVNTLEAGSVYVILWMCCGQESNDLRFRVTRTGNVKPIEQAA